ncbi:MAG: heparin lyase I family protein [Chitinophagaceae bacterium]
MKKITFILFALTIACFISLQCKKSNTAASQEETEDSLSGGATTMSILESGTLLAADGPGNTYELINSVLGGSANESPDCAHTDFGRHITEVYDSTLSENVFVFHIHTDYDGNLCSPTDDRQRNEIKTYSPSPANVKATNGETVTYHWKFKLDALFQPSTSFTHIHQLKAAGDGPDDDSPIITLTPRKASTDRLDVLHIGSSGTTTAIATANLSAFKGNWVEVEEKVKFSDTGTYSIVITNVATGAVILNYSSSNIDMWRGGTSFVRPKWGIYRSLANKAQLRDEQVRFADFCIAEGTAVCPSTAPQVSLFKNCSYGGWEAQFGIGSYTLADIITRGGLDNDASSLKVPAGLKVTIYENDNFGGASKVYTADKSCLTSDSFNDKVSSLVVSTN